LGQGNQRTIYYNLVSSTSSTVTDGGTSTVSPSGTSGISNSTLEEEDPASEYTVIPGEQITVESFLKMTAPKNKLSYAYKNFESVQLGTYTMDSGTRSYNDGFYSFGTSILFDPIDTYTPQAAGLGFFVNDVRDAGYFILIRTSGTAAAYTTTPVEIFKLKGKRVKRITDSQKGARTTLDTIFAGQTYNVDVKVKISGKKVTITAFVNGFKVEAVDETGSTQQSEILYPSTTVALLAAEGSSKFDYVYADTITLDQYLQENVNLYYGQFSNKFLSASFGDFLYNSLNEDNDATRKDPAFEEFGTVVREIKKQSVRFSSAPSIPIKWTVGANNLVNLLGQTRNNFKSESLVLNNTSLTTPLSDGQTNQFAIIGTTIGFSGEIEYSTSLASFYSTNEPVIFESRWLQNEKDVKSLAEWIKGRVVNKAKIINMEVFGNPLIAPGDIITVNYPYQGFTTSQKIIVVKVSQSFQGGLKTQIAARTL
jgi:hypothetical protein